MITNDIIKRIYKKYKSKPASPEMLDMHLLFEHAIDNHGIYVDEGNLVIESVTEDSPFYSIPLDRIHGIVEFERSIAIVLPRAILFLNKHDDGVHVHLKPEELSLLDRIRESLNPSKHPDF